MPNFKPCQPHERIILGLGETGFSCARYFARYQQPFTVWDSRTQPSLYPRFKKEFPDVPVILEPFEQKRLQQAKEWIVSPGIDLHNAIIAQALSQSSVTPVGDIELFARAAKAPIIAITGTNAKGTVTSLVGDMLKQAGFNVAVGGNIGCPALDLLALPQPDFYVLEISSFQLETTYSLHAKIATILNITPDHLDRHKTLEHYINIKQRVYRGCDIAVWNHDDRATHPQEFTAYALSYGKQASNYGFGLQSKQNIVYLAKETQCLLPVNEVGIKGQHNWINALAALTIGDALQLPLPAMLNTLRQFKGLPHRCQWVKEENGICWYNDSKATNVGAALAAINGLGSAIQGKLVLIAGGLGKGADFTLLQHAVKKYVKTLILIGEDAPLLQHALEACTPILFARDLSAAVHMAAQTAQSGDAILLSPACASMDMFKNFEHRGEVFMQLVNNQ